MKKKDQISGTFWLLLALLVIWQSLELPLGTFKSPGPGLIPLCAGLSMGVLSLAIIIKAIPFGVNQRLILGISWHAATRIGIVLGGMLLYALLFNHLGFPLSTFLLLILLAKGVEPQKWGVSIFWASALTILSYFLFRVALKLELPRGVLGI